MTYVFLIASVITQSFNPITELVIPTGSRTKEAKAEIGKHPVSVEPKIRNCSL